MLWGFHQVLLMSLPHVVCGGGGVHKVLMSLHLNSSCVYSKDLAPIVVLDIINN